MSNNNYPKISDLSSPILDAIPDMFVLCDKDTTVLDILHPKEELLSGRVKDLTVLRNTSRLSFVSAMAKKRMAGLTKSSGEIIFR